MTWLKHGYIHNGLTTGFHVASLAMTLDPSHGADVPAAAEAGIRFAVHTCREFLKVVFF